MESIETMETMETMKTAQKTMENHRNEPKVGAQASQKWGHKRCSGPMEDMIESK